MGKIRIIEGSPKLRVEWDREDGSPLETHEFNLKPKDPPLKPFRVEICEPKKVEVGVWRKP